MFWMYVLLQWILREVINTKYYPCNASSPLTFFTIHLHLETMEREESTAFLLQDQGAGQQQSKQQINTLESSPGLIDEIIAQKVN